MNLPRHRRGSLAVAWGAVLVLVAAGVTVGVSQASGPPQQHLSVDFSRAVGVYPGSDVRILGVKVGTVSAVRPDGTMVVASLSVDGNVRIPANAGAVVVAPTLVADRYVQLTPAWTSGPQLADGATIPLSRTATPTEIDQLYQSITQLSQDLGPGGANSTGALSNLLNVGAANLAGNGTDLGNTIDQLGQASKTLGGDSNDLFSTLTSLESFTSMLKTNDTNVRTALGQLSSVSGFLAADRQDLGSALQQLATALAQVQQFIQSNRAQLKNAVDSLVPITQTLVNQRSSLAELLDTAPLAAGNLLGAYDPQHGTLDGRGDLNELSLGGSVDPPLPLPNTGGAG
ncbi:MCE family protein [Streptacidiphilus sp. MAP5-3]|uniref:MCE family protein n=1 Tax=unclassified Streptacidiphilus TaxID=2643834 RepID=UPI003515B155